MLGKKNHMLSKVDLANRGGTLEHLKDKLDEFPALSCLSISLFRPFFHPTLKSSMFYMESVTQKRLPLVKTILVTIYHYEDFKSSTNLLDKIQPMFNVNQLEIQIRLPNRFVTDDRILLYIMKKFPNLRNIRIECLNRSLYRSDITERLTLSADVALRLLQYTSGIEDSHISLPTRNETVSVIENFSSTYCSTDLLDCLHLEIYFEIWRELYDLTSTGMTFGVTTYLGSKKTIIKVGFDTDDSLECCNLIDRAGQYFSYIALRHVTGFECDTHLEYISKYCNRLETLLIFNAETGKDNLHWSNMASNLTIVKLELNDHIVFSNTLSSLSTMFPNLNTLSLSHILSESQRKLLLEVSSMSLELLGLSVGLIRHTYGLAARTLDGACIKVCTGAKFEYFFFALVDILEYHQNYITSSLEFKNSLTASEFDSMKDHQQYIAFSIRCKSIEKFRLNSCTNDEQDFKTTTFSFKPE